MTGPTVTARVYADRKARVVEMRGQTASTLLALVDSGLHGCTVAAVTSAICPFAASVHELRDRYGLDIREHRKTRASVVHSRYVLVSPVEIIRRAEH